MYMRFGNSTKIFPKNSNKYKLERTEKSFMTPDSRHPKIGTAYSPTFLELSQRSQFGFLSPVAFGQEQLVLLLFEARFFPKGGLL